MEYNMGDNNIHGAYHQLALNDQEGIYNSVLEFKFNDNYYSIEELNLFDKITLRYLIIDMNDNDINTIYQNLENYILKISLNNYNVLSLNLSFIYKLEGSFIHENKFILILPFSYLIDLYSTNDTFFTIKIILDNKKKPNIFDKIYLLCENILYNNVVRKNFYKETKKVFYQNIETHDMHTFQKNQDNIIQYQII